MDQKRLTEWLTTSDGLLKAVVAILAVPASIWAAATKALDPVIAYFDLPTWVSYVGAAVIIAAFGLLLWRSFRRFAQASRLERPDAFTLRPTNPEGLIGRDEDLDRLVKCVKRNRLVLLDGESGCGKSALVGAGLLPLLQRSDGLLPLLIRDWGEDWERGPLSAALDALFHSVSQTDRERLGRTSSPDLAAGTSGLVDDLEARLRAVVDILGRRPLLIADQFDDYQARHRGRFLDDEANWLAPVALAKANQFWKLVNTELNQGRLHLLVVIRSDTAAGLACVRFLGEDQTASRTLPRVEVDYLRPLLASIAADDAQPAVVSNPAGGWHELRERLEHDLNAEGAILMQQVRTVMLGLRQLPLLTPRRFRAAGGIRGVETLVISRALRRAGDAAGGGEAGLRTARGVLGTLILRGGPSQLPKAQRASLSALHDISGDSARTETILRVLQEDEVVRPAEAIGDVNAWQLDHDYLARAVLAEARQADRWSVALREGKARYDEATGDWRRRLTALLPIGTLIRVCWERARGRVTFGDAASYARVSAIRPAVVLLFSALIATVGYNMNQDRLLTAEATRLVDRFGGSGAADAALLVWRAPEHLRRRVYDLVNADAGRFERAVTSHWPLAHAGFEPARVREMAAALRARLESARLEKEPADSVANNLAQAYAVVAARLNDPETIKTEVTALRGQLEKRPNDFIARYLAQAYAAVAARLNDPADVRTEATALGARLEKEVDYIAGNFAAAYAAVAARLKDPVDVRAEATVLRARLENAPNGFSASHLARAYAAVAAQLNDPVGVKAGVTALRARLEKEPNSPNAPYFGLAYAAVAARLDNPADVKAEATALRARLEKEPSGSSVSNLAKAYVAVVARLSDTVEVKAGATALRARLGKEPNGSDASDLARAYGAVATRLSDPVEVKAGAVALRAGVEKDLNSSARDFARVYVAVVARLNDPVTIKAEVTALRGQLEKRPSGFIAEQLAQAYAAVAARLTDPADVKAEATALRARLEKEEDVSIASNFAQAYAAVAARLTDPVEIRAEALALRARLEKEVRTFVAENFAQAYAAVAARLNDPVEIRAAATALRARLEKTAGFRTVKFANAYLTVAAQLNDPVEIRAGVTVLRSQLEKASIGYIASNLAQVYVAIAARLTDPAEIKAEAAALRARLEKEVDGSIADSFAQAYASVAGSMVEHADTKGRSALALDILTLAGHPILENAGPLLAALKPAAREGFDSDVGAAVRWAEQTYRIKPNQLRPPPLQR